MGATRAWIWALITAVLVGAACGPALSQELQLEPAPASENRVTPPGPMETMDAYRLVRSWLDAGAAPEAPPAEGLPDCGGASVVVMSGGRVVGRGLSMRGEGDERGRAVWAAASEAIAQAVRRTGPGDALDPTPMRVSLELAGAPVPLSDAEVISPALTLAPGLDGVAVRRGEALAATFPGTILRRNTDAGRAIGALAAELTGDVEDALASPATLVERGMTLYRFRVTHVAEPAPGMAAVFLHRGGRVVDARELTRLGLADFAQGLAAHLEERRWPGVERFGLRGTFDPVSGRHEAGLEDPAAQAVVALALARLARTPGVHRGAADRSRSVGAGILADLAVVEDAERLAPIDPETGEAVAPPPPPAWEGAAASAACVVALGELGAQAVAVDPELSALRDRVLGRLDAAFAEEDGFEEGVGPDALGLVAYGVVRAHTVFERGSGGRARAAVAAAFRDTPTNLLVGQMPWLGWADIELSAAEGRAPAAADLLREMRATVWEHQLSGPDVAPWDRDLVGGIVFTRGRTPLPTWHSARPLAVIATMLGERSLTSGWAAGGEAPAELLRLVDSLRFLRQLAAGVPSGHMYARPERAGWGVRQAPWDQRMPTDASALTLLTVCEALRSMDALAQRDGEYP